MLAISRRWRVAALPVYWEIVHIQQQNEAQLSSQTRRLLKYLTPPSPTRPDSLGRGIYVKQVVFDMAYCPKFDAMAILEACPNLTLLAVHKTNSWAPIFLSQPIPSSRNCKLRRIEWTSASDPHELPFLVNFNPSIVSVSTTARNIAGTSSLNHITSLEIDFAFCPPGCLDRCWNMPLLIHLAVSGISSSYEPIPLVAKVGSKLRSVSVAGSDPSTCLQTSISLLPLCPMLEDFVFQLGSGDPHTQGLSFPPHDRIRNLAICLPKNASYLDRLLACIPLTGWRSLQRVRLIDPNGSRSTVLHRDVMQSDHALAFTHRSVRLEDWDGI